MDSERIDWFSECGVGRKSRKGFLSRIRASHLRRKARKKSGMDPTDLVQKHNAVFGIDSCEPTAAMRYDLRKKPMESTVDPVLLDFKPTQPENSQVVTSGYIGSITSTAPTVPTGELEVKTNVSYDSDVPIGTERKEVPGTADDYFKDIGQKYFEDIEEETIEDCGSDPLCTDEDMGAEAAEFDDARKEDIAQYVEEEMVRETRQTSIDDPIFDEDCAYVTAEPSIVRQERFDVEFEPAKEPSEASATVPETDEVAVFLAAPAETAGIPAPAAVPAIGAPATRHMIGAPGQSVSYSHVRDINAANLSAGRYGTAEAESFESQIAAVEASGASYEVASVQIAQIIGGMLIASRIAANAAVPETAEAEPVAEETIQYPSGMFAFARDINSSNAEAGSYGQAEAESFESQIAAVESSAVSYEAAQVQIAQIIGGMLRAARPHPDSAVTESAEDVPVVTEQPVVEDLGFIFVFARAKNASNVEAGMYSESEAALFESQIAAVEASGASYEDASIQIAQVIGGMLIAARTAVNAVMPEVTEAAEEVSEAVEEPAEEKDIAHIFAFARGRNVFNEEAGRYGTAQASAFESQIAAAEASCASSEIKATEIAQIIGGMIIASQTAVNAVMPEVTEVAEEVHEAVEESIVESAEKDMAPVFAFARDRNAYNVEAGMYGASQASAFEAQIASVEASCESSDVRSAQVAQIIGGMMIAVRTGANAVRPEVPEVAEEDPETVVETVEEIVEVPAEEIIEEDVDTPVQTDVAEEAVPKSSGVSFHFGQSAYRSAVRGTVVRFVFGSASD